MNPSSFRRTAGTKELEYEGRIYEVPADATREEIDAYLRKHAAAEPGSVIRWRPARAC